LVNSQIVAARGCSQGVAAKKLLPRCCSQGVAAKGLQPKGCRQSVAARVAAKELVRGCSQGISQWLQPRD